MTMIENVRLVAREVAKYSAIVIGLGCGGSQPASSPPSTPAAPAQLNPAAAGSAAPVTQMPVSAPEMGAAGASAPQPTAPSNVMSTPPPAASGGISYHKDIRPILESTCLECHIAGGIGPFPLDSWATVNMVRGQVVGAVTSGIMPPSYWNRDCQPLNDDRSVPAAQRDLFAKWRDAGFPEGLESEYTAPAARQKQELGPPSITMSSGLPYTPPPNADEYRCFVLKSIPKESYLTGMQIVPGQSDEVHHVIIYRVAAAALQQAMQLDAQDTKPGYVCSGGPSVASQNMFSYRPGSEAVTFAKGDAAYMEAGSSLIIQVHYNTVFLASGKQPTPDETKVNMWTLPEGQLPERVVYRTTTFGPINIPAGEPMVVSNISQPMSSLSTINPSAAFAGFPGAGAAAFPGVGASGFLQGEVIGMTPHAHQLAKTMHAKLQRADGSSVCLDDVKWDFHWQLDYIFAKGVPYTASDTFVADCIFDNSAANQPVIDGMKQQPRNVSFGERSIDEMCEHYIWLRFERDAFMKARSSMGL